MNEERYVLENDRLRVAISTVGAEVCSIWDKNSQTEYIWQGDPRSWKRKFPILFPIVGKLSNDSYTYQGKRYTLTQHGFARDKRFLAEPKSAVEISFCLSADDESRQQYPFEFSLTVNYHLTDKRLTITYQVTNLDSADSMYYSIGGHPGFNVPFVNDTCYEDYYLTLDPKPERKRYVLNKDSLLLPGEKGIIPDSGKFPLSHDLFKDEAVIMNLTGQEESFFIRTDRSPRAIEVKMSEAPFMDFWSSYPDTGDFVCVEPCWGIADPVDGSQELASKPGIQCLQGLETKQHKYCIIIH